jgi:hypothetical protein
MPAQDVLGTAASIHFLYLLLDFEMASAKPLLQPSELS